MGQEFFINSEGLENKIRQLLPSQGGAGAGFDLSASTQIIPIIDLTESAEGSSLREDLQTSLSFNSITSFSITNATNTVIVNNTGYYRVFGSMGFANANSSTIFSEFNLFDGSTAKSILKNNNSINNNTTGIFTFDFIVFLGAGESLRGTANDGQQSIKGVTRQIATIDNILVDPT
jgi:hypothetical protein